VADHAGARRASIIGTGLIGGSIGLGLRAHGWHVSGSDATPASEQRALELGAIDAIGLDPDSEVTVVAVPVHAVAAEVQRALAGTSGVVTDVGSVKGTVVAAIDDPRFVGGHPMAGSEQLGVDGSTPDMFAGAVWVLTPVDGTDPDAHSTVRALARTLGADVVELAPERHDALVAVVSHVPHLTAAALMSIADQRADEHAALLRLAAGGFRDMTRIAAGTPTIWPDICAENREAIVEVIDELTAQLGRMRTLVSTDDRVALLDALQRAQAARRNLPSRVVQPEAVVELRVTISDRPGGLAEVTTLAAALSVNIADIEIAHSSEGDRGVLILLVDRDRADAFRDALAERGYRPSIAPLA
jgi:prephenate dehydrogenase